MLSFYRTVRENPIVSGLAALLGLLVGVYVFAATVWGSIYIDRPFLPTVWGKLRTVIPAGLLWLSISFTVVIVSAFVLIVVTMSAIRKKPRLEAERLARELKGQSAVISTLTDERDEAIAALKDRKTKYAMETLENYSRLPFKDPKPHVTVRYANYDQDYDLAQKIQGLFIQYVKWPVKLEASTSLPRAEKCKVLFDVGKTYLTYGQLIHAISEGELLGVRVGRLEWVEREDSHHLIVMVLPSVGATPIKADPV